MCSLCEALAFVMAKHLSRRTPFRSPAAGSPAKAAAAAAAAGDCGESTLAAAVVTKRRAPQHAEPGRRRAVGFLRHRAREALATTKAPRRRRAAGFDKRAGVTVFKRIEPEGLDHEKRIRRWKL